MTPEERSLRKQEDEEILLKQDAIQKETSRMAEEYMFTSCITIGVVGLSKGARSKVAGFDGSMYEVIGAMEEFIAEFKNGDLQEFEDDEDDEDLSEPGDII